MTEPEAGLEWLGRARYERWRLTGPRVRTVEEAGRYLVDVGLALLFPEPRIGLPSLWEAVARADAEPFAHGMGPAERAVWTWKDQLPLGGLAWYGRFARGRATLVAPDLLAALYPGAGTPDDYLALPLSPAAHELAGLLVHDARPSAELRATLGRRRYERAAVELQRQLLVTTAGVHESDSGWPAAVVELTCRLFDVGAAQDARYAAARFVRTALAARPADLAKSYGWTVTAARAELEHLAESGMAERSGSSYIIRHPG